MTNKIFKLMPHLNSVRSKRAVRTVAHLVLTHGRSAVARMTREGGTLPSVPRMSFGLSVFNGGALLRESLESILAQTTTGFEPIISDNVSTGRDPVDYLFETDAGHPRRSARSRG